MTDGRAVVSEVGQDLETILHEFHVRIVPPRLVGREDLLEEGDQRRLQRPVYLWGLADALQQGGDGGAALACGKGALLISLLPREGGKLQKVVRQALAQTLRVGPHLFRVALDENLHGGDQLVAPQLIHQVEELLQQVWKHRPHHPAHRLPRTAIALIVDQQTQGNRSLEPNRKLLITQQLHDACHHRLEEDGVPLNRADKLRQHPARPPPQVPVGGL
mmetsp:Transcript_5314/g.12295  ORF Transcript_5314/g.12295 Transcript_5314/m.12295 type:complete len:218 (-) Transcript_5314:1624-2277(-)